jgi:uncharacterized protein (TIGR00251 family)
MDIDSIQLEPRDDGVVLPVRARPGARRNEVRGVQDGMLKVSVTQVAEKGKANAAVIEVLAQALDVRRWQLELIAGETAPRKKFLVRNISIDELRSRIAAMR